MAWLISAPQDPASGSVGKQIMAMDMQCTVAACVMCIVSGLVFFFGPEYEGELFPPGATRYIAFVSKRAAPRYSLKARDRSKMQHLHESRERNCARGLVKLPAESG